MRRTLIASIAFAACLAAASALAASDRIVAKFDSVAPLGTGVSGQVTLNAMPSGDTQVHTSLRGLDPGTQYVVNAYPLGGACASGTVTTEVWRFEANPAGIANFTKKVPVDISQIGSISLQRGSDSALLSCADVTP